MKLILMAMLALQLFLSVALAGLSPLHLPFPEPKPLVRRQKLFAGTNNQSPWDKALSDGQTLNSAMRSKDSVAKWFFKNQPNFADTVQSPWDGTLRNELSTWGYRDDAELSKKIEQECDFDKYHNIKRAFDELGLGSGAQVDGGPNQCLRVDHYDGPAVQRDEDGSLPINSKQVYTVCEKEYKITGATFEFALNSGGLVALMNVQSPAFAAEKFLWHRKPLIDELPQLRTISDIAWGLWNRVSSGNVKDIKYLMVTQIMNPATRNIITQAQGTLDPPKSEVVPWPGIEFTIDTQGGQAILGSPLGRWAGYFLMQHKTQLGGNRFISKVRVFKNDAQHGSLPYLVFYVDPQPAPGKARL